MRVLFLLAMAAGLGLAFAFPRRTPRLPERAARTSY